MRRPARQNTATLLAFACVVAALDPSAVRADLEWPEPLALNLSATTGTSRWGDIPFEERDNLLQMPGATLELGELRAAGAEVSIAYRREVLSAAVGMGYGTTRQEPGVALRMFGPTAHIERVHLFRWFVEAGLSRRFGDLTPILMLHAAYARALVDIAGAERLLFRGSQFALGPKIALRAHLYRTLFVQAGFFADVLHFPDHIVSLGVGVGR